MDKRRHHATVRRQWFGGVVLILVGSVLLLDRMSMIETSLVWHFWPALIALFGLGHMVGANRPVEAIKGLLMVAFAFWLYASIEHLWGWSFRTTWPLILIGFGLARILESWFWMQDRKQAPASNNNQERTQP